ncbi:tRNA 2-selenouridine(34) synthase MnmH [Teredinibacter purpureus]|uniref:tRNA 2-selenouridine(34) synthase MnmH n=1 Tax=Teredinibacter purpureus TaxID=2731756 RepID=UPI0005F8710A|nr:tRNA 2-selenouridine(34) synthase MnmH [Teredinibacter purpureus]
MTDSADFKTLFLNDTPLFDTRAPIEFDRGSFPCTENLPLMTNEEREKVGTCYKEKGQDAAITLGHKLVCGETKQRRLDTWLAFTKRHPEGYLFCFRGGLRSQICQQWLAEAGCDYPRITGGYKAMRRYLIDTLEQQTQARPLIILGGHTGSAKTDLLNKLPNSIDLEGLANHRGSAFGRRIGGQPPLISFENAIAVALLKQAHQYPQQPTILEDESRLIGRLCLPVPLHTKMGEAPLVLVETTLEERVTHSFENYIRRNLQDSLAIYGEEIGFETFSTELQQSLYRIRKRLGSTRFTHLNQQMNDALSAQQNGNEEHHRAWIETLLRDYYDPMYDYQTKKKTDRVIFRGRPNAILDYLQSGDQ